MQFTMDVFVGVATLAMFAAIIWLGVKQIGQLRTQLVSQARTSQDQMATVIKTSRAALLPQIDTRCCGPEMSQAQQHLRTIYSEIRQKCTEPNRTTKAYKAQFHGAATGILADWRTNRTTQYLELMAICDFYELVGLLCFRGYLHPEDVLDLYSLNIIKAGVVFESHIRDRQSSEHETIYERFLELFGKAREFRPDYDPVSQKE